MAGKVRKSLSDNVAELFANDAFCTAFAARDVAAPPERLQ
jgi:hypothetical protein